tara:strand:- start:371 stop:487 length:117 start_codon:yes stop_codon:yes gene_type:complete
MPNEKNNVINEKITLINIGVFLILFIDLISLILEKNKR